MKSSQKQKIREFMQLTNCSEKIALNCLSQNEWRLDLAINVFFKSPEIYAKITDRKKIENWFYKYSQNGDKILVDGVL
jgi:DCN1-like protein 1/2